MKFFFLIGSLDVGGAETQLVLLARGLAKAGHEVHFATIAGDGPLAAPLRQSGVVVHHLLPDGQAIPRLLRRFMAQFRLITLLWRLRPDVVQAYLPLTCLMGAIAGRLAGTPCIVIGRRALATHQDRVRLGGLIDRIANGLAHAITANSEAVRQDHMRRDGLSPERICVIPNAIEVEKFLPDPMRRQGMRQVLGIDAGQTAILCVGNLIPYKGHADLIAAIGKMGVTKSRLHLFLAGRREKLGEALTALAAQMQVPFTLLGPRDDIPDLLQAADLFVLPSHEEGSSNALLEAIMAGVPAVATDVGGNPALLLNGDGGWLCPPRDPVALADAIAAALADSDARTTKASLARREAVKKHDPEALIDGHMALYERVFARRGRKVMCNV
jgi:glycosyltransferase involved in cell wall biosynthesis